MTRILIIHYSWGYYSAVNPQGTILIGGPHNHGDVDGTNLLEVMRVAIENADVIHAPLLEVTKK